MSYQDITQIIPGITKDAAFRKGHVEFPDCGLGRGRQFLFLLAICIWMERKKYKNV